MSHRRDAKTQRSAVSETKESLRHCVLAVRHGNQPARRRSTRSSAPRATRMTSARPPAAPAAARRRPSRRGWSRSPTARTSARASATLPRSATSSACAPRRAGSRTTAPATRGTRSRSSGRSRRTPQDVALLLHALAGPDPRDPLSIQEPWPLPDLDERPARAADRLEPRPRRPAGRARGHRRARAPARDARGPRLHRRGRRARLRRRRRVLRGPARPRRSRARSPTIVDRVKPTLRREHPLRPRARRGPDRARARPPRRAVHAHARVPDPLRLPRRARDAGRAVRASRPSTRPRSPASPMGSYLEWFRSCSRITVTAHPAIAVPAGFTPRRPADRPATRRPPPRRGSSCCGSRTRSPRPPGLPRARRSSDVPWPTTPPTAAHRAAYARRRAAPVLARDAAREPRPALTGTTDADLCIVGGGFTGLWAALHAKAHDPARDVVLLEAETAGFGASGRNGGFAVASLTHGIENGLARFADEMPMLERLGLENFAGLQADLDAPRHRLRLRADRRPARAHRRLPGGVDRGGGRAAARASATTSRCSTRAAMRAEVALADLPRRRLGPHRRRRCSTPASSPPACATPRCAPACGSYEHSAVHAHRRRPARRRRRRGPRARAPRPARHQRVPAAAARDPPLRRAGLRLRAGHRAADRRSATRSAGSAARASATAATSSTTTA